MFKIIHKAVACCRYVGPTSLLRLNTSKSVINSIVQPSRTYAIASINKEICQFRSFTSANKRDLISLNGNSLLKVAFNIIKQQERTVTKFSLRSGKRKTVKAVIKRFKRLDWGEWIRTHSGRHKKMWRKSGNLKRRLRQHVFVNATQSWLLDKMVTKFWRKPKHYIDDFYKPYHTRNEYFASRKTPLK